MSDDFEDNPLIYKSYKSWIPHLRTIMISFGSLYIGIVITYYEIITSNAYENSKNQDNATKIKLYLTNNIVSLGAVIGCIFVSRKLYNRISRSKSLIIGCGFGVIGTSIILISSIYQIYLNNQKQTQCQIGALGFVIIYLGRFIQGIALGVFSVNCILFIYELSPLEIKIILGGFFQLFIQIGIIGTKAIQLLFDKQYVIIILPCFALLSLVILFFFCIFFLKSETPKFLISRQRKDSIYKQQCARQILLDKQAQYRLEIQVSQSSFFESFNMSQIKRKALFLGIFVWMIQQASGINVINIYGSFKQQQSKKYYLIIESGFQFLGTASLILINCIQKCAKFFSERQKLLQYGTFLILIPLISNLILEHIQINNKNKDIVQLIMFCIFMFIFGFTIGPVAWLYSPQIMQNSELCFAIASMWLFSFLNVFLTEIIKLSKITLLLIIWQSILIILFLIALFLNCRYKWIIQTKNKTKLEITRIISQIQKIPQFILTSCSKSDE